MFKNYLTYSFALKFRDRCIALDVAIHVRRRLAQSADTMIDQLSQSIHARDAIGEASHLCVAYQCLKDCREVLDQNGIRLRDLDADYEIVHERLEKLCLKAAESEGGQLRLLA